MSFWRNLFDGLFRQRPDDAELTREQLQAVAKLIKPAIRLRAGGSGFSRVGGWPDLPPALEWPHDEGKPLAFLAQIDLTALPEEARELSFPAQGYLWFFYDQAQSAWGGESIEFPKWRVLFAHDAGGTPVPQIAGLKVVYNPIAVSFETVDTLPDYSEPVAQEMVLSDAQWETYIESRRESDHQTPLHQLGGWPYPIQNGEMENHCNTGMKTGDTDWRLLLQIDSDDTTRMNWVDGGMLYFWIRDADLKAARFDRVWMVLQCH